MPYDEANAVDQFADGGVTAVGFPLARAVTRRRTVRTPDCEAVGVGAAVRMARTASRLGAPVCPAGIPMATGGGVEIGSGTSTGWNAACGGDHRALVSRAANGDMMTKRAVRTTVAMMAAAHVRGLTTCGR